MNPISSAVGAFRLAHSRASFNTSSRYKRALSRFRPLCTQSVASALIFFCNRKSSLASRNQFTSRSHWRINASCATSNVSSSRTNNLASTKTPAISCMILLSTGSASSNSDGVTRRRVVSCSVAPGSINLKNSARIKVAYRSPFFANS